jgi:hypothetical protein
MSVWKQPSAEDGGEFDKQSGGNIRDVGKSSKQICERV